jgi:hypothetical protein
VSPEAELATEGAPVKIEAEAEAEAEHHVEARPVSARLRT